MKLRITRAAVSRIHALSLVYGSTRTETRWNVVSHCSRVRPSPWIGVRVRSSGGLLATAGEGSAGRGRVRQVHPIERLRYVARSSGADPALVVRETAGALAGLGLDPAGLVTACRRIVERHPTSGPLWWLCARTLTAAEPLAEAWRCVEAIECDTTADELAMTLPDESTVCVVGWPDLVAQALIRRGDVLVLAVDAADGGLYGHGGGLARRLQRADVEVEEVAAGGLGRGGRRGRPRRSWRRRPSVPTRSWRRPRPTPPPPSPTAQRSRSGSWAGSGACSPFRCGARWSAGWRPPVGGGSSTTTSPRSPWSRRCAGRRDQRRSPTGWRRIDCPVAPELLRASPF